MLKKPVRTAPIITHNKPTIAGTHTLGTDEDTRAATRVSTPSELGNGKGKVDRAVVMPQPPPNKHSVDGDGDNAPAHKKPRRQKKKGGNSKRGS